MKLILTIQQLPTGVSRQVELTRDTYDLARLPGNDIVVRADGVSRKHAKVKIPSNDFVFPSVWTEKMERHKDHRQTLFSHKPTIYTSRKACYYHQWRAE